MAWGVIAPNMKHTGDTAFSPGSAMGRADVS